MGRNVLLIQCQSQDSTFPSPTVSILINGHLAVTSTLCVGPECGCSMDNVYVQYDISIMDDTMVTCVINETGAVKSEFVKYGE